MFLKSTRFHEREAEVTDSQKIVVPTYFGARSANLRDSAQPDFGPPCAPILLREEDGLRVVLGIPGRESEDCASLSLERRPHGWAIFLHPIPPDDLSELIYLFDDGRRMLAQSRCADSRIQIFEPDSNPSVLRDIDVD